MQFTITIPETYLLFLEFILNFFLQYLLVGIIITILILLAFHFLRGLIPSKEKRIGWKIWDYFTSLMLAVVFWPLFIFWIYKLLSPREIAKAKEEKRKRMEKAIKQRMGMAQVSD